MCESHRRSQRTFKLSANYDHRLDAKASSTGLRRHWILKAAKCAHKVCDLHTYGAFVYLACAFVRPASAFISLYENFSRTHTCIELIVPSLLCYKILMAAPLNNPALLKNHDTVGIFYR